jgi:S1-C subfamily serine protease
MIGRLLAGLACVLAVPALAVAVARPPEPRLRPADTPENPSYVQRVQPAIVGLHVKADPHAASSSRLGVHRFASGVIFDPRGYAVTVSYAVLDAERVEAQLRSGAGVPARLVGLDLETGLAVVKLGGPGPWPAATLGDSRDVRAGDIAGTVGVDEDNELVYVSASVQAIRRFAGFWEYMLERALLVAPGSASWGGSAVVNDRGHVVGVASLRIGAPPHVNVAIPMEKFIPVKEELIVAGRVVSRPPRPWLGLYTVATEGKVVVEGFSPTGPAARAGFRRGDTIVGVNDVSVRTQEEFYEQLWRGRAGDVVRVAVRRDAEIRTISVRSVDRYRLLKPIRN